MEKAVITFRIEKDLKADMKQTCQNMGINMTTAFRLFCYKVITDRQIPFEIEQRKNNE